MKTHKIFSLLSILIILALIAAAFPHPAQAAICKRTHVVKSDDTLSKIATRYHTTSTKLAYANNLDKPYTLTPGQTLCIPSDNVPSTRYKWSGVIKGNQLLLTGDDFRKDYPLLVNAKTSSKDRFYYLGKAVTNSGGDLKASFTLTPPLTDKNYLTICLKNRVSGLMDCKRIFKQ